VAETITAAQLRAAADLISDRRKWTTYAYARYRNGVRASVEEPRACRWCAVGAVARVSGVPILRIGAALAPHGGDRELSEINDCDGHAAAIAELRRLADLDEARERAVSNA